MSQPVAAVRVTAADVELKLDPQWFPFETTADVPPLVGIAGQPRAVRALEVGIGIRGGGYNVYAAGLSGASLLELIRLFVAERVTGQPTPPDWAYVHNFDESDRPLALQINSGQASQLKKDMRALVTRIREELPKAFRYEGFGQEKERLREEYETQSRELYSQLEALAKGRELAVQSSPEGQLMFLPIREGKPLTPEEAQQLGEEEIEAIGKKQQEVFREAQPLIEKQRELTMQLTEAVRNIEKSFAEHVIQPLIQELAMRYANERLTHWLGQVKENLLDNLGQFRSQGPSSPQEQMLRMMMGQGGDGNLTEYDVNVVVDNTGLRGPPVLVEDVPTYKNLFGIIERTVDRRGWVASNFTQIKAGSILRANGGYILFNLDDALTEPLVWKELKRTLKNRRIHIDTYEPISFFSTSGIKPEAIPLDVRVVVVGSAYIFHLLSFLDNEFGELFKVKADFAREMPLDADSCSFYAQLVKRLSEQEQSPPFEAPALAELVRHGSREVGNRTKVSADFSELAGLVREACYWARHAGAQRVAAAHVFQALEERVYRSNWIAQKINELILDGTLLIDTADKVVGQINGLAVLDIGDYAFGRPSRVTASSWVGRSGVLNIERESRLSGKTHDKGMLILEGYLRHRYARSQAISLGASLAFEQSYSGIDGDSASAAELFCLLSSIAGFPLRQDIAVTGSINQFGQVQAIGGINEKVEGFYDVCRVKGLTGNQGVLFPKSNLQHMILRRDVLEAVRNGQFHLWTMESIDQGLELLAGLPPGDVDQPDTIHGRVAIRLKEINEALRDAPAGAADRAVMIPAESAPQPPGPPPLPPQT